jgi:hypothetical protein
VPRYNRFATLECPDCAEKPLKGRFLGDETLCACASCPKDCRVPTAFYQQEDAALGKLALDRADESVIAICYLDVEDDEIGTRIC